MKNVFFYRLGIIILIVAGILFLLAWCPWITSERAMESLKEYPVVNYCLNNNLEVSPIISDFPACHIGSVYKVTFGYVVQIIFDTRKYISIFTTFLGNSFSYK